MRIIARSSLVALWERHPETQAPLKHWEQVAKGGPLDIHRRRARYLLQGQGTQW